jgi:protein involved in polysaccharide export with SLBB domain
MNALLSKLVLATAIGSTWLTTARAGVEPGDSLQITLRGVPADEQAKINGLYRVTQKGSLRLPFLDQRLPITGLNAEQIASAAESAYRNAGIYNTPAIEVEILSGDEQKPGPDIVSVGGQVNRAGQVPFREGITLIQALQLAGDRNAFGGRNITIHRNGKAIPLDFRKPEHKNFPLRPNDAISVGRVGIMETDRG